VRKAFRKEKELLGKLEYYNVKFIGYKGISYGQVITNPMPRSDKDMLYWLDKIDLVEKKLKKNRLILNEYIKFLSLLEIKEKILIRFKCEEIKIIKDENVKNVYGSGVYYKNMNRLIRKWIAFIKYI
jgi:type III secretory pathway component EscV